MVPIFRFKDVTEKDMDYLIMEEMAASDSFCALFLSAIGIDSASLVSIEHSQSDTLLGESDLVAVFQTASAKRLAILIEDKIDAVAQPNQAERYLARAKKGVAENLYEEYTVFIVAPEDYLHANEEAHKYPCQVSYETILHYFTEQTGARAEYKRQLITQALTDAKMGYQVKRDDAVTSFWEAYGLYASTHFPDLGFKTERRPRGATSTWTYFPTILPGVLIAHKADRGIVDLAFPGEGQNILSFEMRMQQLLGDYRQKGLGIFRTGKSAAVRLLCPTLDFHKDFSEQISSVEACFLAVRRMAAIAKQIGKNWKI